MENPDRPEERSDQAVPAGLFEMEGIKLSFTEDALKSVAARASFARRAPADCGRSWKQILLNTMFDLPGLDGVEEVVINAK